MSRLLSRLFTQIQQQQSFTHSFIITYLEFIARNIGFIISHQKLFR